MATKSISQLDTQATANETDLFEVAIVDANSASGYASKKESAAAIADAIVGEYQYPLRITGTTAKTIAGAINELSQRIDLLEDVWGLEYDFDNSHAVRLAGANGRTAGSDFDNFAPWQRRRCILTNDGVVLAYYGEAGYTETGALTEAITKDGTTYAIGTEVQVMVEQKPVWYRVVPIKITPNIDSNVGYHGQIIQYYVTDKPKVGFTLHPAFYGEARPIYLSAYEGSYFDTALDRIFNDDTDTSATINAGDKLCSIGNNTKPISGMHKELTKPNLELIAQNRGANWHLETIQIGMLNLLLFAIEYASFNSQNEIGASVTSITNNPSYNCASLTGSTASLGNASGRATSTINEKGTTQTTETDADKTSVSYRGVENIWGNIYKLINGVNIHGDGTQAGGQIFVNPTLSGFSEQTMASPYVAVSVTLPKEDGYIKYFGFDSNYPWLLSPSKIGSGADSTKPIGDYCFKSTNLNGYRITLFGGGWYSGAAAGASCWSGDTGAGTRGRNIGGRLMYIPSVS